jgi:2-polyprenyl-3-methyl-5-hydroxy-6-metoxy-1,4-benzoquinol methylase
MNTLKKLQGDIGREQISSNKNTYNGIPMFCDEGLHESCFSHIKSLPKDVQILVLGSGSGSFDQRLIDNKFQNITSVDFRPDFFRASGSTFIEKDLNEDFSNLGIFDIVVAIELIEHLENPAHFMRNVAHCLKENGTAIITTPNIESGPSRASFFTMGCLTFFTKTDMDGSGHISPLLNHIFNFHAKNAGLKITTSTYNRSAWVARILSNTNEFIRNIKSLSFVNLIKSFVIIIKTILLLILSLFTFLNSHTGNIHIYVLRKS